MSDVKIPQGYAKRASDNTSVKSFNEALKELATCGCGIECDCYGYLTLPNWNSVTGERTDGYAIYIVDGAVVVDTVANAKAAIEAYKAI